MRWSQTFIPTLRETPADAEVASHKFMLRAGLMRRLSSGVYSHLPLGLRVIQKVERIVREELARIGAEELLLPILHPAELWQETRRWQIYGPELMRLKDRHERAFALGPTHEEVITDLVRGEVRSYRQLPINLYQIQTKFRDEIRPRFGVLRSREFVMKDAYSFHADEASLEEGYDAYYKAYSRIFTRCGLEHRAVLGDTGAIGGAVSHEFTVLAATGESEILSCACGYAATSEKAATGLLPAAAAASAGSSHARVDSASASQAASGSRAAGASAALPPNDAADPRRVTTPGKTSAADVAAFLGAPTERTLKTLVYVVDEEPVFVMVRGDREINEAKLLAHLQPTALRLATPDEILAATGGPFGFTGPIGLPGSPRLLADLNVRGLSGAIVGANALDEHLVDVDAARDLKGVEYVDLLQAVVGDPCPVCGSPLQSSRGIEVGQIFKLGDKYSKPMGATYLNEAGEQVTMLMGCYGIGITRTVAAAIEQHHDERGILWPLAIAPFQIEIVALAGRDPELARVAEEIHHELVERGWEVLLDDRDERPGSKFADADLIGIPFRVVVGERGLKQGVVELRGNAGRGEAKVLPLQGAAEAIDARLRAAAEPPAV
jgi:prolyl-tRNA synthetase